MRLALLVPVLFLPGFGAPDPDLGAEYAERVKPILSKPALSAPMRITFLPPTLTARRRATNMVTGRADSLRIVRSDGRRASPAPPHRPHERRGVGASDARRRYGARYW